MSQLLASGPQVAITCTGRMIVQSAFSDLMKIKRAFGRLLSSESCRNLGGSGASVTRMRTAFLGLTIAALCQAVALAQTSQPSEAPTTSATPASLFSFDSPRSAAGQQSSSAVSATTVNPISAPSGYQLAANDQIAVE